jgi:hypothetical protein
VRAPPHPHQCRRRQRHRQQGAEVEPRPPLRRHQQPRRERRERQRGEDAEVQRALRPVLLRRCVGLQRQRRGPGEQEVPAHAEQEEGDQEAVQVRAGQGHGDAQRVQRHADGHDRQHAEALDELPGEEARREHADDVPLQHQRRVGEGQAALVHRDRRRGHQQVTCERCSIDVSHLHIGYPHACSFFLYPVFDPCSIARG